MKVETMPDDWMHRWFDLQAGHVWALGMAIVAAWMAFVWCWPNIQKLRSKAGD
ncbi:hypothetical protein HLH44_19945 [Gluconacetobacter sp. 1c LMG 22058]|uniref:Uncharacterized protein n=1 Tax=Gluconacetobacter dulcium TaxID=2729096 RepID=A0A7W4PIV0_9PROT|nr:hypothetical protein [Gluconacetobacter dulcium]MBB2199672.1 hypothetical protein [Gluconacetobacter dulcium]